MVGGAPDRALVEGVRALAQPLRGVPHELDALLEAMGRARFVLLGGATHGTREFYRLRALLTRQLLLGGGFAAVAVEADWPDALRVCRYVRGEGADASELEALGDFDRFPRWMWRNTEVRTLVGWMREDHAALGQRAGFYGLDLFSLNASARAVVDYLAGVDPEAAERARRRYACLAATGPQTERRRMGMTPPTRDCEELLVRQLRELQRRPPAGPDDADQAFWAEQNARLAARADAYYRALSRGDTDAWNLRERYMAQTAEALAEHLGHPGAPARLVLWAHNSHVGDARATETGLLGEVSLGQLLRERYPGEVFLLGFTGYGGTVTAAREWGGPPLTRPLHPALPGSWEHLFHQVGHPRFVLPTASLREGDTERRPAWRLERALGVVYAPEVERWTHYLSAGLPEQFDAVVHLEETHALTPLDARAPYAEDDVPETYPSGL